MNVILHRSAAGHALPFTLPQYKIAAKDAVGRSSQAGRHEPVRVASLHERASASELRPPEGAPRHGTRALVLSGSRSRTASCAPARREPHRTHAARSTRLIGENGAGKSTLVKILSGAVSPGRRGDLLAGALGHARRSRPLTEPASQPSFQELSLDRPTWAWPPTSCTADGAAGPGAGRIDRARSRRQRATTCASSGSEASNRTPKQSRELRLAERQMLEICRALSIRAAEVLVLDEPDLGARCPTRSSGSSTKVRAVRRTRRDRPLHLPPPRGDREPVRSRHRLPGRDRRRQAARSTRCRRLVWSS